MFAPGSSAAGVAVSHGSASEDSPAAAVMPSADEDLIAGGSLDADKQEALSPGEGQGPSPRFRRKSWRRSAKGRRSLLSTTPHALCGNISLSLSNEEREQKLMEMAMELAVEKLLNSLQSLHGASLETLQSKVETVKQEWQRLRREDMRSSSSTQSQESSHSDPEMKRAMEQIKRSINSLQGECRSWEALLAKHSGKAEELARRVAQGRVALDPAVMSQSSQKELILSKPDYGGILSRQQTVLHSVELLLDTQYKVVRGLLSFQEQCHMLVKEASHRLACGAGFQDLSSSPVRKLLRTEGPQQSGDNLTSV